jgi:hypothetical protein
MEPVQGMNLNRRSTSGLELEMPVTLEAQLNFRRGSEFLFAARSQDRLWGISALLYSCNGYRTIAPVLILRINGIVPLPLHLYALYISFLFVKP